MKYRIDSTGYIVFDEALGERELKIRAKVYDSELTIEGLGERYYLAMVFYVLHRYYASMNDEKGLYYLQLQEREMAKVKPVLDQYTMNMGGDL